MDRACQGLARRRRRARLGVAAGLAARDAQALDTVAADHAAVESWLVAAEASRAAAEVVALATGGCTSRSIAGRLGVSVRTVDNLGSAYRKLGITSRRGLNTPTAIG